MDALIAADLMWAGGALREGWALRLRDGRIAAAGPLGRDRPDRRVHLLMPGATDLQVNGGGGVLFNADPSPAGLAAIRVAHRSLGTHAILPTVITDVPEVMEAAADAVIAVWGMPGIAGIHIEGPHIAPERRGTHDARHIRPMDERTLAVMARLRAAGIPVLLTLAPELADPVLLARARALGVVLSAGHSSATVAQAELAFANGVGMATHLFNAMPPLHHREPGLAAAAILSDAWLGLIPDGIHVDWAMLRLALAARPRAGRCFIVSDAMPSVGGPAAFTLYGRRIALRDGRLVNADGALAGAHLDMMTGLARLHLQGGVALGDCIAMAGDVPRRAMGLAPLALALGTPADHIAVLDGTLGFAGWLDTLF
ncbi:N-acetylglucosamine-6-phosphate deacetylase [Paracoccus sp. (in: a-proteobacteria)]|uniref:N-acetylglucosamine-6-phosphate deacetylase n=1 Tax=Paracoccus sp. TaxID=267 RepID=UPI0026DEA679|nr:amidohydrolase family protein [Paracoccus sp. (in: a-proteobacteria)]MDO5368826.1 amidohydrolase family protein [Paracoccus sp. (in: a-proteobacteria)]